MRAKVREKMRRAIQAYLLALTWMYAYGGAQEVGGLPPEDAAIAATYTGLTWLADNPVAEGADRATIRPEASAKEKGPRGEIDLL